MSKMKLGLLFFYIPLLASFSGCSLFHDLVFGSSYEITIQVNNSLYGAVRVLYDNTEVLVRESGTYKVHKDSVIQLSAKTAEEAVFTGWSGAYALWEDAMLFTPYRDMKITAHFHVPDDPWLVMVYMSAANNLESEGISDLTAMEYGLFQAPHALRANMTVVVLFDRISTEDLVAAGYDAFYADESNGNWSGTRLYEVKPDRDRQIINSRLIETAGTWRKDADQEEQMGNRETLENFVSWAAKAYPEHKRHALILWNHGSGVFSRSLDSSSKPVPRAIGYDAEDYCSDTQSYGLDGQLFVGELQKALSPVYNQDFRLELIGFDACYMGMYEIAYEFRDLAKYFVASPAVQRGGWNYLDLFQNPFAFESGASLAKEVVYSYRDASGFFPNTMAAFELSQIHALKDAVDALGAELAAYVIDNNGTSVDLATRSSVEDAREASLHFFDENTKSDKPEAGLFLPYYDLGSVCENLLAAKLGNALLDERAKSVIRVLKDGMLATWYSSRYGPHSGDGLQYGLSIFFSRGDRDIRNPKTEEKLSHYAFHWHYTDQDTAAITPGRYYGYLDAADLGSGSNASTWKDMLETFYNFGNEPIIPW